MSRHKEAGQALVLSAVALTILMLSAGLAVDMGYFRYEKRRMQAAADSAAIAAASELQYSTWQSAAVTDSKYNGFANGVGGVTVTANCPPSTGPFASASCDTSESPTSSNSYVEVLISQPLPTFFMKIAGVNSVALRARAVAHLGSATGCVYGLSILQPATDRFGDEVGLDLSVPGCTVYDNGSLILMSHSIHAKFVGYVGTFSIGDGVVTPSPVPIAPVGDPLAYLPREPAPSSCSGMPESVGNGMNKVVTASDLGCGVTVSGTGQAVFTPGSYSGPIQIQDWATVTFQPGTYILGQGLAITGTAPSGDGVTVSGDGVMFYNTGSGAINICTAPTLPVLGCPTTPVSGATNAITLSAPNTGPYAGILMMQDPADVQPAMLNGNNIGTNTTTLQGVFYFPTAQLSLINLSSPINGYAMAIAKTVSVGGNVFLGSNYSTLPNGTSPIKSAVLAE